MESDSCTNFVRCRLHRLCRVPGSNRISHALAADAEESGLSLPCLRRGNPSLARHGKLDLSGGVTHDPSTLDSDSRHHNLERFYVSEMFFHQDS